MEVVEEGWRRAGRGGVGRSLVAIRHGQAGMQGGEGHGGRVAVEHWPTADWASASATHKRTDDIDIG